MRDRVLGLGKYIITFLIAAGILILLFLASVKIVPRDSIRENMHLSAEYLIEKGHKLCVIDSAVSSRRDVYADSVLLGIAWDYDENDAAVSVMDSDYYDSNELQEYELLSAIEENRPGNTEYLRYWHGSLLFVRPLLKICSVRGMLVSAAILMVILTGIISVLLIRRKAYASLAGFLIGLIAVSAWFIPISLEYIWCFLIMLFMSVSVLCMKSESRISRAFLVCGMVTSFMDFLTTETVTLLVPALLLLSVSTDSDNFTEKSDKKPAAGASNDFVRTVKCAVLWGFGYAGMWLSKWIIASIVLNINAFTFVGGHIKERTVGTEAVSLGEYLTGAITRNIGCLLPLEYGGIGKLAAAVIVLISIYIAYVYRRKDINTGRVKLYLLIGLVPYLRFLILHDHAYNHFFFTYRAQAVTVMAIVLIMNELTDWRSIRGAKAKRRKS